MQRAAKMQITRFRPTREKRWGLGSDGAFRATIYMHGGVVEVFTWPGDDRGEAFTTLEMWIYPNVYRCWLPRHYHPRWLRRLARQFLDKVIEQVIAEDDR